MQFKFSLFISDYLTYMVKFLILRELLTDVTRLNFIEVARAAFFSKAASAPRQEVRSVARAGLVH